MHAGVDGYSRVPVFLHCSNNNRASTVLDLFQSAVAEWGLPSRVRCDKESENTDIDWLCCNIQNEVQEGDLLLQARVYTIKG